LRGERGDELKAITIILVACVCLCATPAYSQMTCEAANTSAESGSTLITNVEPMPTAAPANATLWVAIYNRSDETTGIADLGGGAPSIVGTVNATGWAVLPGLNGYDNTAAANSQGWLGYKVGATAGTDTVTVTFDGAIFTHMMVGWCSDASGAAQTFDAAADASFAAGSTNYDSATAAATGAGGIIGIVLTTTQQDPVLTVDGAGETLLGSAAPTRVQVVFEPYASGGNYGIETTIADASAGVMMVAAFKNGAAAASPRRLTLLGVGW
jgi:hypothetical protein